MGLIAVSGYAGSGKDTVGIIIQYLLSKPGKPSIEEVIENHEENEWWLEESSGWEIRKFAGKLKDIASHITGIDVEDFEDPKFKEKELGPEWSTIGYNKRYLVTDPTEDTIPVEITEVNNPMTVRELLQKLGTDAMRNGLHPNVWVNALFADYVKDEDDLLPNWIITDCRFQNEAIAVKNKGGIIIRVERPGVKAVNDHPSETALDDWNFDYKIVNISDLVSLMFTVENILKHAKLLK